MASSNVKKWVKPTDSSKMYLVYLKLINGMLRLTNKETEVAAALFSHKHDIDKVIADSKTANEFLFSIPRRKQIRDELGMSSLLFNNHLQALKKKGIVIEREGVKYLNDKLKINPEKNLEITFKLNVQGI